MKESSWLNPKMAAYCQAVHELEDKFDGLELNHVPRCLNEAAVTLAKIASKWEPVPTHSSACDLYKQSIRHIEAE